jgi:hypothetical protein
LIAYGHSHFFAARAGEAAAAGFGVVHATQALLSPSLVTSQTEHVQDPAFGLKRSINEGFGSSSFLGELSPPDFAPKVNPVFGESVLFPLPNEKLGFAAESDLSPNPKPDGLGGSFVEDFSPNKKAGGFAGSFDGFLPKGNPDSPVSLIFGFSPPKANPDLTSDFSPKAKVDFFSGSGDADFAPKEKPVAAGLPAPKAKDNKIEVKLKNQATVFGSNEIVSRRNY